MAILNITLKKKKKKSAAVSVGSCESASEGRRFQHQELGLGTWAQDLQEGNQNFSFYSEHKTGHLMTSQVTGETRENLNI